MMQRGRAILLALALLLQGLVPAAAFAHDEAAGQGLEICTLHGLEHRQSGHRDHGFAGLACEQCVLASLAMVSSDPPPVPVRAEAAEFAYRPIAERPSILPRAPPRPPSQGPPASA
jgi:hypothetical protein